MGGQQQKIPNNINITENLKNIDSMNIEGLNNKSIKWSKNKIVQK